MTGDSANGRSTRAFRSDLPTKCWRTSTHAVMTPKNVVTTNVMAVMTAVRKNACCTSGRWNVSTIVDRPGFERGPHDADQRQQQQHADVQEAQGDDAGPHQPALAGAGQVGGVGGFGGLGVGAHQDSSLRRRSRPVTSTSTNDRANSTVATAAASTGRNWFASWKMNTGAVSVLFGTLPATSTTLPNSPRHRAKVSRVPPTIAGRIAGKTIR